MTCTCELEKGEVLVIGMIYKVKTKKRLTEVAQDLEAASRRHKFGVMGVHDLKSKMSEKGVKFDRDCMIFEVCNPHQAKQVLEKNPEISTALPCRISVYSEGDEVVLATIKPTAMLAHYQATGLDTVAGEVDEAIVAIMQEAAK